MKKKVILSVIIFLLLIIIISLAIHSYKKKNYYPDINIHVSGLYQSESRVINIQDEYYYLKDKKLYKISQEEESVVYTFSAEDVYLKSYDNKIWAYVNNKKDNLIVLDTSGKMINTFTIPDSAFDFIVDNDTLFCSYDESIIAFTIKDNQLSDYPLDYLPIFSSDSKDLSVFEFSKGNIIGHKFTNSFQNDSYCLFNKNHTEYLYNRECIMSIFDANKDYLLFAGYNNNSPEVVYQPLSDEPEKKIECSEISSTRLPKNLYFYNDSSKNIFVSVSETVRGLPTYKPHINSDSMRNHANDYLCILNTESKEFTGIYKTKTFERIIFADAEKAITYYNGKYCTYSLEDWSAVSEVPADEIKEGGEYIFETCGKYIFVFDNSTGELINKISVV